MSGQGSDKGPGFPATPCHDLGNTRTRMSSAIGGLSNASRTTHLRIRTFIILWSPRGLPPWESRGRDLPPIPVLHSLITVLPHPFQRCSGRCFLRKNPYILANMALPPNTSFLRDSQKNVFLFTVMLLKFLLWRGLCKLFIFLVKILKFYIFCYDWNVKNGFRTYWKRGGGVVR